MYGFGFVFAASLLSHSEKGAHGVAIRKHSAQISKSWEIKLVFRYFHAVIMETGSYSASAVHYR